MIDASWLSALHDVLVVAQTSSVAEAAKRLGKTPSAVSQQLRRVESRFGPHLFEKHGRHIRLTAAGEAAIGAMTRVFDEAQSLYTLLEELAGARVTTLRLAASDYLGQALLLPVIRDLVEERVPLHFEITTTNSIEARRLVAQGLADVAILSPTREVEPDEIALFQQDFCWVAPRRPGVSNRSVTARLLREPLLRLSAGSQGRILLDELLGRSGLTPVSTIDLPSVSQMLLWVSQGLGIGLVPRLALWGAPVRRMVIEPAAVPSLTVRLGLRPTLKRTVAFRRFLERLESEARKVGERLAG